jgi:hypothetical protein
MSQGDNYSSSGSIPVGLSSEDSHAKIYPSQVSEQDSQDLVQDSSGKFADYLMRLKRNTSFLKMSQGYSHQMTDETWEQSSKRWSNAGMGSRTEFWTLSISEYPSDAVESSLSEVLETTGEHLRKYSLSRKAAMGILDRAGKRERSLPTLLQQALEKITQGTSNSGTSRINQ